MKESGTVVSVGHERCDAALGETIPVEDGFELSPTVLASSYGFRAYELNEIRGIIEQHETELTAAWDESFG